jgi:hypothetical protein
LDKKDNSQTNEDPAKNDIISAAKEKIDAPAIAVDSKKEYYKTSEELKRFESWMIRLTIVGSLIALGTGVIFYFQLKVMREQLSVMSGQLKEMQGTSKQLNDQIAIAKESNRLTRQSNEINFIAIKATNAAEIEFNPGFDLQASRTIMDVGFVNRGQLDATDFLCDMELRLVTLPEQKILYKWPVNCVKNRNVTISKSNAIRIPVPMVSYSKENSDAIRQMRQAIILDGKYSYINGIEPSRVIRKICLTYICKITEVPDDRINEAWRPCESVSDLLRGAFPKSRNQTNQH